MALATMVYISKKGRICFRRKIFFSHPKPKCGTYSWGRRERRCSFVSQGLWGDYLGNPPSQSMFTLAHWAQGGVHQQGTGGDFTCLFRKSGLPNLIYRSSQNFSKLFLEINKLIVKFIWRAKRPEYPTQCWKIRRNLENWHCPTLKLTIKLQ